MIVHDKELGECELEISVDRRSAVDSFIESAYLVDHKRDATDGEIDLLNETFAAEVQEYSYHGGGSRNHN